MICDDVDCDCDLSLPWAVRLRVPIAGGEWATPLPLVAVDALILLAVSDRFVFLRARVICFCGGGKRTRGD